MIKKIDYYIVREFLIFFIIFIFGIFSLYIIVDFFEKLDKFLRAEVSPGILILYYFFQIPDLYVLLLPPALLLTPFFAIGGLARKKEILAMKASGINLYRIFIPLLILGLFFTISAFVVQEVIRPFSQKKFTEINYKYIRKITPPAQRVEAYDLSFFEKGGKYFYVFGRISSRDMSGSKITVLKIENEIPVLRIDAKEGKYNGSNWVFYRGIERIFDTHGNPASILEFREREYPDLQASPFSILKEKKTLDEMNINEILSLLKRLKDAGFDYSKELVEAASRVAFPLVNLLTLFFALPLSFTLEKSGRTFSFALTAFITFFYWSLMEITKALGYTGKLPPMVAPWIPNLLFFFAGFLVVLRVRR